jgi:hypothetical protein
VSECRCRARLRLSLHARGQRRPSRKTLRKLAPKLETTAHWLETGAPDPADELAALVLEYEPRPLPRRATQLARRVLGESASAVVRKSRRRNTFCPRRRQPGCRSRATLIAEIRKRTTERDKINAILQEIIDEATTPWGIKVSAVEVKDVEIPAGMQRAMARQAEAERERRAKVINAEGEFQASERLKDAALVIEDHPIALQLRYLQTLLEIGGGPNASTIIFPAPIDLIATFLERGGSKGSGSSD